MEVDAYHETEKSNLKYVQDINFNSQRQRNHALHFLGHRHWP